MAEVFVARARSVAGFEKVVALKMIHSQLSEDPEFSRLLVEEANITAQLSHRNIVQVIDLGQIDGTHYIAMEFVDGCDLSHFLAFLRDKRRLCPPRVAAFVVRDVCDGLEHAHRKVGTDGKPLRIVHRDVSPPNILLSNAGEVKLTDFGIAKAALRAKKTQAGAVKGKYGYMAPEQARGESVDLRVDIFSAGCVLYELLAGVPVYPDAPLPAMLPKVSRGQFAPLERVRPDTPPALLAVVRRALAVNPAERYPSARAMADDLNTYLFKLPPDADAELARLVGEASEASGDSGSSLGTSSLLDDEMSDSTQIETMASMRQKIAQATGGAGLGAGSGGEAPTRAVRAPAPGPDPDELFADEPTRLEDMSSQRPPPPAAKPSRAAEEPGGFVDSPTRAARPSEVNRRQSGARAAPVPSAPKPTSPSPRASEPSDDGDPEATMAMRRDAMPAGMQARGAVVNRVPPSPRAPAPTPRAPTPTPGSSRPVALPSVPQPMPQAPQRPRTTSSPMARPSPAAGTAAQQPPARPSYGGGPTPQGAQPAPGPAPSMRPPAATPMSQQQTVVPVPSAPANAPQPSSDNSFVIPAADPAPRMSLPPQPTQAPYVAPTSNAADAIAQRNRRAVLYTGIFALVGVLVLVVVLLRFG